MERGIEQGRDREKALVLHLLDRRLEGVNDRLLDRIRPLPIDDIEALREALLDFETEADLLTWLSQCPASLAE